MLFSHIMGKRESLNLEQLRKQEWGQDYSDKITTTRISRQINGEAMMVSTPTPQRQSKDWGEVKADGAIYNVVLKKVRYHTTTKLPFNESVSYLEWETQKRLTIKAGSLVKLVEHLSPDDECIDEVDPGYLIAFLTMYQTFSSADEVVALLFDRFRKVKKTKPDAFENVMKGIIKVLLVWLEHFPDHFSKDPNFKLLKQMQTFVTNELTGQIGRELFKKTQQIMDKAVAPSDMSEHLPQPLCDTDSSEGSENAFCDEQCRIFDFETTVIAEQLTFIDAELFKLVVPQHCVGCIWSRRDKNENNVKALSVKATVNQFNAVSLRVVATILVGDSQGSSGLLRRTKAIEAWIEIAQECRDLKNFSSLKAIMSALQSVPIHRLKRTWSSVSRNHILSLDELSKLVSEDGNQKTSREVLQKEGTAKTADISKKSSLNRKQSQRNPKNGYINGTVPYLGTFLTDLMMLDSAYSDLIDGNLINFEKRRKEFEIITQIKLFQEAAKNYYIQPNEKFKKWFESIEMLSENDCFTISCESEPNFIHKKNSSLFRIRKLKSENDLVRVGKNSEDEHGHVTELNHRRQYSNTSCISEGSARNAATGRIVRVSLEDAKSCNLYKSIWVSECDRTPAVIKSSLLKHHLDDELPNDYTLVQILDHRNEVTIPKDANVYYATNTKTLPLSFVIRKVQR